MAEVEWDGACPRRQVEVETVQFVIATEDGALVEAGAAMPEDGGSWWRYETSVGYPGGARGQPGGGEGGRVG